MTTTSEALGLVHEGWNHLRLQRPLAAWASWQRALRLAPADTAARQALAVLENAGELPAAARSVYRFRAPSSEPVRSRWDARLRGGLLDDLDAAAEAFLSLVDRDPTDADAAYDVGLCLAWQGRNLEAIAALDRVVQLRARDDFDLAVQGWTLAEVLRLGSGAEREADDLRYVWTTQLDDPAALDRVLDHWPNLRPVSVPIDPLTGSKPIDDGQVFEWLDRECRPDGPHSIVGRPEQVARVLATVIRTPRSLRLSTPDPSGLERLSDPAMAEAARLLATAKKEATPLPLAWADAALGTFRFPTGLDTQALAAVTRGVVERYFETIWVHHPRHALGGRTPVEAARLARNGDPAMRARLEAVVRFREHLGSRPTHALLYQGYPFDRLRRRLGLIGPEDTAAVDPNDLTCSSESDLDALDPSLLDGERLADAFTAAAGLGDDSRTARFAAEITRLGPASMGRLDLTAVLAPLVREALGDGNPVLAIERLQRGRELARDDQDRRTLEAWTAEVQARSGRLADALETYQTLIAGAGPATAAAAALDGAETMLDNGDPASAAALLLEARALARTSGDHRTEARADDLLSGLEA